MNKMAMGVVALATVLASPMARAENIVVQASETKTISSTPAEQPESAEIHGTLKVSGGAVVLPKTVALGCAAGDNARIELSGSGTRFGEGLSEGATAFTIGANGGFGTILNDGGNTDMDTDGVGLGSLTVSADAVTAGGTLDVLTLKSGYVSTSGMYNDNAKPARLLFAGGALRSGQAWGSALVGRGDFIWESVNGSGMTVDLSNYGNGAQIGPGRLTIRGTGDVTFKCSWGDGTSNNAQFDVSEPIVWAGSNNLYLGDNAKLNMTCNDTLPFGRGKGTVTAKNGNSKLVFAAVCTQHVNSVTATAGGISGKGALVFGADDLDGTLAATIADETDIIKIGSGTLTVSAATAAAKSTLQVDAGTVLVKAPLTLASCSVAAGAHLIVDGTVLTFPAGSLADTSSIECINGGRIVTPITTAWDGSVKGLCFGGESVLDKSGAGRLMVYDPENMPATIRVNEGGVTFSKLGCTDTFYRWTIRENLGASSGKTLKIGELALFDGTGKWIDWPSPTGVATTKAVADFARGEYQLVPGNLNYAWMIQGFQVTLDHIMDKGNDAVFMHTEFKRTPQESDQATWQVISWRLPEGANSLSSFDVCSGAPGDWGAVGTPISWTFESSPDGTTWKLLHELTAAETIGTRSHGHWMSGGDFKSGVSPKEMFELSNYITKGVVPGRTSYAVEMAAGTTLDVSAADAAGFALDGLTLSLAGGMTLKGAQLAETGTLTLTGIPASGLPNEITILCAFADCTGLAGLENWIVMAEGRKRDYSVSYDAANAVLRLHKEGPEPFAHVEDIDPTAAGLDVAVKFTAGERSTCYANWKVDFLFSATEDIPMDAIWIADMYGECDWLKQPLPVDYTVGEELSVMELMGYKDDKPTYDQLVTQIKEFSCGASNNWLDVDTEITIQLIIVSEDGSRTNVLATTTQELKAVVAKVGETHYTSLQAALNAVGVAGAVETNTVRLVRDVNEDVTLGGCIDNAKAAILDLNGWTLTGSGTNSVITIDSGSALTLTDTSDAQTGAVTMPDGVAAAPENGGGVYNCGTFTMAGGRVKNAICNVGTISISGGLFGKDAVNSEGFAGWLAPGMTLVNLGDGWWQVTPFETFGDGQHYIESSNGAYIDTEYHPTLTTRIVADFNPLEKQYWGSFFGLTKDDQSPNGILMRYYGTEDTLNGWFCNDNYHEAQIDGVANRRIQVELKAGGMTVDGTNATITTTGTPYDGSIYVFSVNCESKGGPYRTHAMRLYSFRIYDIVDGKEKLVRDLVPFLTTDGTEIAGLYDRVTQKCFINKGEGTLTLGCDEDTGPTCEGGTIEWSDAANAWVITPNAGVTEITVAGLPEEAKVVVPPTVTKVNGVDDGQIMVKSGTYDITGAFTVSGGSVELNPNGIVTIGDEEIPVKPTILLRQGYGGQVGDSGVSVTMRTIPGLKYSLIRGAELGAITMTVVEPTLATEAQMTLTDAEPPTDKAFYRIDVSVP